MKRRRTLDDLGTILLILVGVFCVLPLLLFGLALLLVIWRIRRLARADVSSLQKQFHTLQQQDPRASDDQLVKQIIRAQASKCGIIGALTGLGGFFTILIALPLDVMVTSRIQATTVQFIATHYGFGGVDQPALRQRTYLALAGGDHMSRTTQRLITGFLLRIGGKALAKFMPLVGLVSGYVVSFAVAQASGQLALAYYSSRPRGQSGGDPGQ
jgi:hypothetical protein